MKFIDRHRSTPYSVLVLVLFLLVDRVNRISNCVLSDTIGHLSDFPTFR